MILGNKEYSRSPVQSQSFVWVADYDNNNHLAEYDFDTLKPNSFYNINKENLIRFGLIGNGSQVYFEVANGIFSLNGTRLMISYATETCEYPLTGRTILYNDIITYKEAFADADLVSEKAAMGRFEHSISSFNIGYKKKMELEGVNINFQNVLTTPLNDSAYFQIKISADHDLNGHLLIRKDGTLVEKIEAPLVQNMTGIINWDIK